MWQDAVKVLVAAAVVVAVAELGKRSSFWGALLPSLPLTFPPLAFIWLYIGTAGIGFASAVPDPAVSPSLRCRVLGWFRCRLRADRRRILGAHVGLVACRCVPIDSRLAPKRLDNKPL